MSDWQEREHGEQEKPSPFDRRAFDAAYEKDKDLFAAQMEHTRLTDMNIDLNYGLEEDDEGMFRRLKGRLKKKKEEPSGRRGRRRDGPERQEDDEFRETFAPPIEEFPPEDEPKGFVVKLPQEYQEELEEPPAAEEPEIPAEQPAALAPETESRKPVREAPAPAVAKATAAVMDFPAQSEESEEIVQEIEEEMELGARVKERSPGRKTQTDTAAVKQEIKKEISDTLFSLRMKKLCAGILSLLLLWLGLSQSFSFLLPKGMRYADNPQVFIVINLVLLALLIPVAIDVMAFGFTDLCKFHPGTMSMVFLLFTVTFVHTILLLFVQKEGLASNTYVLAFLPAVHTYLYYTLEYKHIRKIKGDFKRILSKKERSFACVTDDAAVSEACGSSRGQVCVLAGSQQTADAILPGFMDKAYDNTPIYKISRVVYPLLILAAIAGAVFFGVSHKAVPEAFTALTLYLSISILLCPELLFSLPYIWGTRSDKRRRATVIGYDSVRAFADVDELVLSDEQLLPGKSISMGGIKLYGDGQIDQAIVETASVFSALGAPVAQVLVEAVDHRRLIQVDSIRYKEGRGIAAMAGGDSILIGTRDFMREHRIYVPDEETRQTESGRLNLYVARNGELNAVMALVYSFHDEVKKLLHKLCTDGVRLHIRTFDPLLTASFLADQLDLEETDLTILPANVSDQLDAGAYETDEAGDILISYGKSFLPLAKALLDCVRVRQVSKSNTVIAAIGAVLGAGIISLLLFASALVSITPVSLLVYGAIWLLPVLLLSFSLKM